MERTTIVAAVSSGDIITVDLSHDDAQVEVVGCLPTGIETMSWSPDQDVCVVVSCPDEENKSKVVVMSSSFDVMIETHLNTSETGSCQFVNVGWGSKATQFHGSEGKQAAKVNPTNKGVKLASDSGKTLVSWRRDGSLFATSSLDPDRGHRVVRVWSREGVLQYTSDVVDGLDAVLAWRPSQEVIGVTQWSFNQRKVSFLEKNGLFLEGFSLPLNSLSPGDQITPTLLSWSNDSNIMSVVVEKRDQTWKPLKQFVLFYTTKNHVWYLKHVVDIEQGDFDGFISALIWDPVDPSTVHFCQDSGVYSRMTFDYVIERCQKDSSVAVIDGRRILITPFSQRIIPPPMTGKYLCLIYVTKVILFAT